MKKIIFATAVLVVLAGCEQRKLPLFCNPGEYAWGASPDGTAGPWIMTKSGRPMIVIGDYRGRITGPQLSCEEAEKLLGIKAKRVGGKSELEGKSLHP